MKDIEVVTNKLQLRPMRRQSMPEQDSVAVTMLVNYNQMCINAS
jgi:hypothetical protein